MRFLSMIRIEENTGQVPSQRLMTDMGKLIEEMTQAGVLLDTAGLTADIGQHARAAAQWQAFQRPMGPSPRPRK